MTPAAPLNMEETGAMIDCAIMALVRALVAVDPQPPGEVDYSPDAARRAIGEAFEALLVAQDNLKRAERRS